jgi:hypothetical protein
MGLFDSSHDTGEFEPSGGLVGRLLAMQNQRARYQPTTAFVKRRFFRKRKYRFGRATNPHLIGAIANG